MLDHVVIALTWAGLAGGGLALALLGRQHLAGVRWVLSGITLVLCLLVVRDGLEWFGWDVLMRWTRLANRAILTAATWGFVGYLCWPGLRRRWERED